MGIAVRARVVVAGLGLAVLIGWAQPAAAQFRPPEDPAIGEKYHVEGVMAWWDAEPSLLVSSTSIGIPGTDVDLVEDLGIVKKRARELRLVLRPARKHKFRLHYLPISYDVEAVVQREFVFNGQRYRLGLPVNTKADIKTWRVGYEYDFVYMSRGYAGVLLDVKYTDISLNLDSPIGNEFTSAVAPIPTIGFAGRGYIISNVSITGELSFFSVPDAIGGEEFDGAYLDYDFYGTVNFTHYVGAQVGYRSIDVDYRANLDSGVLNFKGWYFSGVVRF